MLKNMVCEGKVAFIHKVSEQEVDICGNGYEAYKSIGICTKHQPVETTSKMFGHSGKW